MILERARSGGENIYGNGLVLSKKINAFSRDRTEANKAKIRDLLRVALAQLEERRLHTTLISHEGLVGNFSSSKVLSVFVDLAREAGFQEIKAILFLRNPFEHMCSWYLQDLKMVGKLATAPIENYARNYNNYATYLRTIESFKRLGLVIECRNYSAIKKGLLGVFIDWLGLDVEKAIACMTLPPARLNRSLDYVEQACCEALARAGIKPALLMKPLLDDYKFSSGKQAVPYVDRAAL
jgi:hypothetical protein